MKGFFKFYLVSGEMYQLLREKYIKVPLCKGDLGG
jgi:hypothetical protein